MDWTLRMIFLILELAGILALGGAAAYGLKHAFGSSKPTPRQSGDMAAALVAVLEERDPLIRYSLALSACGLHEDEHRDGWLIARKPENAPLTYMLSETLPGGFVFPSHGIWLTNEARNDVQNSLPWHPSEILALLIQRSGVMPFEPTVVEERVMNILFRHDDWFEGKLHAPLPLIPAKRMESARHALAKAGFPSDNRLEMTCVSAADWVSGLARRHGGGTV